MAFWTTLSDEQLRALKDDVKQELKRRKSPKREERRQVPRGRFTQQFDDTRVVQRTPQERERFVVSLDRQLDDYKAKAKRYD